MVSVVRPFPALMLVLALLSSAVGCTAQGEGERCEKAKTQNADCEPPLVCIVKGDLLEGTSDRCCPAVSGEETDSRCTRKAPGTGTGGTSGAGGTSGTGGTSDTGGTSGTAGASDGSAGDAGESGGGGVPASDGGMSGGGDTSTAGAGAMSSMAGQGGAP